MGYARLHESDISDTELQVGKFLLPKPGQKATYETNTELYWHLGEDDVSLSVLRELHIDDRFRNRGGCLGCSGMKVRVVIIIGCGRDRCTIFHQSGVVCRDTERAGALNLICRCVRLQARVGCMRCSP